MSAFMLLVNLFRKVPLWAWAIAVLLVCLYGSNNRREAAEALAADRQAIIVAMEAEAAKVVPQAKEIVTVEVVKYQDRIKYIKGEAHVIEKQVPIYLPADTPDLPGGFRLLHDAAAQGRAIAEGASGNEAAPVPAQTVALTVTENYASCLQDKERLRFYQQLYDKLEIVYGSE